MKLEEEEKLQNVFKSNLNETSRGRHKSKEQKSALENIKLLYKWQEAVVKLFNDYSSIVSKYKSIHGEGPRISAPKQILQRLPIALTQVKAVGQVFCPVDGQK